MYECLHVHTGDRMALSRHAGARYHTQVSRFKCSIFWVISAVPDFYSKPFSHFRIKGRCKEYVIIKYYIILLNILFWDTHNNAFIINTSFFQKPLLTFSFQGMTSWPLSTYCQGTASLYEGKNMDIRPYFRRALPYCLIHC